MHWSTTLALALVLAAAVRPLAANLLPAGHGDYEDAAAAGAAGDDDDDDPAAPEDDDVDEPVTTTTTTTTTMAPPPPPTALATPVLERLFERLATIEGLQTQTLRRLEGLDYRLTRVEIQVQERGDSVREATGEAWRRLQSLEAEVGRIGTLLDVVRDQSDAIRTGQAELKVVLVQKSSAGAARDSARGSESAAATAAAAAAAASPRLQLLLAGMNSLRTATHGLRDQVAALEANATLAANATATLEVRSRQWITRADLQRGLDALLNAEPGRRPAHTLTGADAAAATGDRPRPPRDCHEAAAMGHRRTGVHQIRPDASSAPFFVQCEMEARGGGWTVIQQRRDGAVSFLRQWVDYKHGFGNLAQDFWLGLEKIHMLTNQAVYELVVELTDFDLIDATAEYAAFAIGAEAQGYDLRLLGAYSGDAGDSLTYHVSMKFSTPDADHDQWSEGNCAADHLGGWWYRSCDTSNLNGQYLSGHLPPQFEYRGMYWYDYRGPLYSLMRSRMMIRPVAADAPAAQPSPPPPPPPLPTPAAPTPKAKNRPAKDKKKKESRASQEEAAL